MRKCFTLLTRLDTFHYAKTDKNICSRGNFMFKMNLDIRSIFPQRPINKNMRKMHIILSNFPLTDSK